jgi:hypothetical protein
LAYSQQALSHLDWRVDFEPSTVVLMRAIGVSRQSELAALLPKLMLR